MLTVSSRPLPCTCNRGLDRCAAAAVPPAAGRTHQRRAGGAGFAALMGSTAQAALQWRLNRSSSWQLYMSVVHTVVTVSVKKIVSAA